MIVNAPTVVASFLTVVQGGLAISVAGRSAAALRAVGRARTAEEQDAAEVGALRPALQSVTLVIVILASGALLIEVLGSYVPIWPSILCIEGVTRIGTGTVGAARHLPWLLDVLFVTKPALVLLGAAWCAAHAVQRRAGRRPGRSGPALLLALGVVALLDAVAEAAYLFIPKEERFLSAGCCVVTDLVFAEPRRSWMERVTGQVPDTVAIGALLAAGVVLVALLAALARRGRDAAAPSRSLVAAAVAIAFAASVAAQHVYVAIASPRVTGISTHRCGWCVVEHAPLGGVSAGLAAVAVGAVLVAAFTTERERANPDAGTAVSRGLWRIALAASLAAGACAVAASM